MLVVLFKTLGTKSIEGLLKVLVLLNDRRKQVAFLLLVGFIRGTLAATVRSIEEN